MNGVCVVEEKGKSEKKKSVTYNNDRKFTVRRKYSLGKELEARANRERVQRELLRSLNLLSRETYFPLR